jgi:hypothetical protein
MSQKSNTVNMEVTHLFNLKNKQQFSAALLSLRRKYKDEEIINRIEQEFSQRYSKIKHGAAKFAMAVRKRYNNSIPYHLILSKARAHARKHNLSDAEFGEFQRMYEQELSGTIQRNEVILPLTNMMKVLGNVSENADSHFNIDEKDYRYLQEIIALHERSRPLHAQTILQSLQYNDLNPLTLQSKIDKTKHNPGDHVHPIIAAMFLPKINIFDSHFLYSNISGIVKTRYNKQSLTTKPDYELFYNLVTDPNDIVCDSNTPIIDLLNRCNLQNQLWNAVLHLRNSQVYNTSFREFITAIDTCRLNKYDNPDMIYGRHDGTVIKRLVSAFSFRPTVITTIPISNVFVSNPYAQNVRPTVTSIPMINVRLQKYQSNSGAIFGKPTNAGPIKLKDCLTQPQTFIEGNVLVQRVSDVIYSREVLIFYIDRRSNILNYGTPFNLSRLPTAVAGFERINDCEVDIDCSITIRDQDKFCLRSVVVAETQEQNNTDDTRKLVVGSSTFVFDYDYILDSAGNPTDIKGCEAGDNGISGIRSNLVGRKILAKLEKELNESGAKWVSVAGEGLELYNAYKAWINAADAADAKAKKLLLDIEQKKILDPTNIGKVPKNVLKYFNKFLIPGTCATASQLIHYDPAKAFKNNDWACYDVKTTQVVRNPSLDMSLGKGKYATRLPTTDAKDNVPNGLSITDANNIIKTQGIVFIYQNFNSKEFANFTY